MIRLAGVSYDYLQDGREHAALSGIDLAIHDGKWLTVLGANGSGKTTLAMLLNGLLQPQKGCIDVDGYDPSDPDAVWEVRRRVAYIFQNPENQLVATTIEEDVAFGPENLGLPREEIYRRVANVLRVVGMEGYREHEPHLLSGGQKQKVAIAGALAMEPRYLIMDEATSMLDPISREEILAAVADLHRERGIGIINISHFIEEALLGDEILVLSQGKVALQGNTGDVLAHGEALEALGIGLPPIIKLGHALKKRGYLDATLPLTVEEMVNALCRSK